MAVGGFFRFLLTGLALASFATALPGICVPADDPGCVKCADECKAQAAAHKVQCPATVRRSAQRTYLG